MMIVSNQFISSFLEWRSEVEANVKLMVQLKMTWDSLILRSHVVIKTYIQWGYIGDTPTQKVPI